MKLVLGVALTLAIALALAVCAVGGAGPAERKTRHKSESATEDFEFEEEIQAHRRQVKLPRNQDHSETSTNMRPHKLLKLTQDSELCLALRCSKEEHCLVKNENVALCVANKKSARDRKFGPLVPTPSANIDIDGVDEEDDEEDDDDDNDDDDDDDDSDDLSEYENESLERRPSLPRCPTCPVAKPTFVCGSDNKTYSSPCRIHYHNCVHQASIKMACKGFCPCQFKYEQKQKQVHQRWNNFINKYKLTVDQKQNGGSPKITAVNTITSGSDKNLKLNSQDNKKKNMADKFTSKTDAKSASNHNPPLAEDKQRQKGHNSVLSEKMDKVKATVTDKSDCTPHQLKVMQNRLLDWFVQLITEAKKQKKMHLQGAIQTNDQHCQPQVEWVFNHLDNDPRDDQLSLHELEDLERDAQENCMKPFLEHCDSNRDADLTPAEWCACFDSKERPCLTAKTRNKSSFMDTYIPSCDEHGYYQATQCSHTTVELCWCVDKHGVEYANTRMKGKPDCDSIVGKNSSEDSEDEDSSDDESLMEGSADQPLDI